MKTDRRKVCEQIIATRDMSVSACKERIALFEKDGSCLSLQQIAEDYATVEKANQVAA